MKKIILPLVLILFTIYTNAQQAFTNKGNLQIHTGTSVSGFGNFTNTSTGVLVNNGNLYIKQNIVNDQASIAVGAGTLYLNGTSSQQINGSQPYRAFNINVDNSTGIVLNNNLHVSGTHTFTAGIVTTSATPIYVVYEAGSAHTGSTDASHVNGWVKKIGSTNFVYPVGNAAYLRSIAVNSLSGSSEFNVRYLPNTPNIYQLQSPLKNVTPAEYWTVNRISGGTASVAMNWDNSKVAFPNFVMSEIAVAAWNGSLWTDVGGTATGNTATTGNIVSNTLSSFNLLTIGSKAYPVPLVLIKFTAARQDNYTKVDWTTVNEFNVSHFKVERSDNRSQFYFIGQLPARNSGNLENYSLNDTRSMTTTAWYRLRSIDFDGKESISKVVAVTVKSDNHGLALVTNPVQDKIMLRADNGITGRFDYQLYRDLGQLVQQGILNIPNSGLHELPLDRSLSPGTYLLRVTDGLRTFQYKLIKL